MVGLALTGIAVLLVGAAVAVAAHPVLFGHYEGTSKTGDAVSIDVTGERHDAQDSSPGHGFELTFTLNDTCGQTFEKANVFVDHWGRFVGRKKNADGVYFRVRGEFTNPHHAEGKVWTSSCTGERRSWKADLVG